MNAPNNENEDGVTSSQLTQAILREVRPYLVPGKVQQAEQQIGSLVVQELYQEFHQGPLPPPRQLGQYDQVLPGAAERIIAMAENEQAHRHVNESRLVSGELRLKFTGQIAAFASLILMIGLIAFMVWSGHPTQAASLGAVMITGVVGLFLAPKFFQRPEPVAQKPASKPSKRSNRRQ